MLGIFKKFKAGFSKTVSAISRTTHGLFGGKKIDASSLEELEEALYTADFGVETTEEILEEIQKAYRKDKELKGQDAAEIGAAVLERVLEGSEGKFGQKAVAVAGVADPGPGATNDGLPTVVALIGVNGSGKTTTAAKLGHLLKGDGQSVMLDACDTFRATRARMPPLSPSMRGRLRNLAGPTHCWSIPRGDFTPSPT